MLLLREEIGSSEAAAFGLDKCIIYEWMKNHRPIEMNFVAIYDYLCYSVLGRIHLYCGSESPLNRIEEE